MPPPRITACLFMGRTLVRLAWRKRGSAARLPLPDVGLPTTMGRGWLLAIGVDRVLEPRGVAEPGDHHTAHRSPGWRSASRRSESFPSPPASPWCRTSAGKRSRAVFGRALAAHRVLLRALARGRRHPRGRARWPRPPSSTSIPRPVAPAFMMLAGVRDVLPRFDGRMDGRRLRPAARCAVATTGAADPTRSVPLVVLHLIGSPCLLWAAAPRPRRAYRARRCARTAPAGGRERLEVVGRLASGIARLQQPASVVRVMRTCCSSPQRRATAPCSRSCAWRIRARRSSNAVRSPARLLGAHPQPQRSGGARRGAGNRLLGERG